MRRISPKIGLQNEPFPSGKSFVPVLYIGTDGKLRGGFWLKTRVESQVTSSQRVDDSLWHHVALVGSPEGNTLFLDGVNIGTREG